MIGVFLGDTELFVGFASIPVALAEEGKTLFPVGCSERAFPHGGEAPCEICEQSLHSCGY